MPDNTTRCWPRIPGTDVVAELPEPDEGVGSGLESPGLLLHDLDQSRNSIRRSFFRMSSLPGDPMELFERGLRPSIIP